MSWEAKHFRRNVQEARLKRDPGAAGYCYSGFPGSGGQWENLSTETLLVVPGVRYDHGSVGKVGNVLPISGVACEGVFPLLMGDPKVIRTRTRARTRARA